MYGFRPRKRYIPTKLKLEPLVNIKIPEKSATKGAWLFGKTDTPKVTKAQQYDTDKNIKKAFYDIHSIFLNVCRSGNKYLVEFILNNYDIDATIMLNGMIECLINSHKQCYYSIIDRLSNFIDYEHIQYDANRITDSILTAVDLNASNNDILELIELGKASNYDLIMDYLRVKGRTDLEQSVRFIKNLVVSGNDTTSAHYQNIVVNFGRGRLYKLTDPQLFQKLMNTTLSDQVIIDLINSGLPFDIEEVIYYAKTKFRTTISDYLTENESIIVENQGNNYDIFENYLKTVKYIDLASDFVKQVVEQDLSADSIIFLLENLKVWFNYTETYTDFENEKAKWASKIPNDNKWFKEADSKEIIKAREEVTKYTRILDYMFKHKVELNHKKKLVNFDRYDPVQLERYFLQFQDDGLIRIINQTFFDILNIFRMVCKNGFVATVKTYVISYELSVDTMIYGIYERLELNINVLTDPIYQYLHHIISNKIKFDFKFFSFNLIVDCVRLIDKQIKFGYTHNNLEAVKLSLYEMISDNVAGVSKQVDRVIRNENNRNDVTSRTR